MARSARQQYSPRPSLADRVRPWAVRVAAVQYQMRPITSFDEVTDNTRWAREMRDVYEGRIDRLDLMIGMFAEPKPTGFGFSDTAFRIFILMASRRLKSDRYFGEDFTPEMYTPVGMQWIENTSMIDVLQRHYPNLRTAMSGTDNAFAPWRGARA